jgi:hypothetical protein
MYYTETIGKFHADTLRDINNPSNKYYIEPATNTMDCRTLSANYVKLQQQIDWWFAEIGYGKKKKEEQNIYAIIDIQQGKQDQYAQLIQDKCTITTGGGGNDNTNTGGGNGNGVTLPETPTTTTSGNTTLILLAALAAYLFFIKK